jgi:phage terminase Nu1 subunit (DNA packaging protein)
MATALGITPGTLDAWVRDGCPVEDRPGQGKAATFHAPAVVRWHLAKEVARGLERVEKAAGAADLDALRAEGLRIRNEAAALDLAERRGELVKVDEIAAAMCSLVVRGRVHVMNTAPSRIAARATVPGANVREIAREEIKLALIEWHEKGIADAIAAAGGDPALADLGAEA